MGQIKLYVDGKRMDWYNDEGMTLIQSVTNVKDLAKLISDYSKSFTLPATPTNNEIFGHYYDIDIDGTLSPHYKVEASLEGVYLNPIYGILELQGVTLKRGKPDSYMVNFYGAVKQLSEILGNTNMDEIDWSSLAHVLNYSNVVASWGKTLLSGDVVYPLIDWQRGWFYSTDAAYSTDAQNIGVSAGGILISELKPAIRLKKMIELIFSHFNLTATGSALSTEWIEDVYIVPSKNAGYMFDMEEVTQQAAYMSAQSNTFQLPGATYTKLQMPSVLAGANPPYNPATAIYTVPLTGVYKWDMTVSQTVVSNPGDYIDYILYVNGSPHGNRVRVFANRTNFTFSLTAVVSAGDLVEWYAKRNAAGNQVDYIKAEMDTFPQYLYGVTIDPAITMPSTSVIDFIRKLREGYNLIIKYTGADTYEFIMHDTYYSGGKKVDLTGKVDMDTVQMKKVPISKRIQYKFLRTDAYANQVYKNSQAKEFAESSYEPDVDFSSGEQTTELPFAVLAPTVLENVAASAPLGSTAWTDLHFWNALDTDGEPVHIPFLGMFIPDYYTQETSFYMQNGVSGGSPTYAVMANYPYATFHNAIFPQVADTKALAYCVEVPIWGETPTVTIFTEMWQRRVEQMYLRRSRLNTFVAYIDRVAAEEIELNDEMFIDGVYYQINEIKYDTLLQKMWLELLVRPLGYVPNIITGFGTGKLYSWSSIPTLTQVKVMNINTKNGARGGTKKDRYDIPVSNLGILSRIKTNLQPRPLR